MRRRIDQVLHQERILFGLEKLRRTGKTSKRRPR